MSDSVTCLNCGCRYFVEVHRLEAIHDGKFSDLVPAETTQDEKDVFACVRCLRLHVLNGDGRPILVSY